MVLPPPIYLPGGKGLINPSSGKFVKDADDCCCGEPCTDCAGSQPNAVVSISGSCHAQCWGMEGIYTFSTYTVVPTGCRWYWTLGTPPNVPYLDIWYCQVAEAWCADLRLNWSSRIAFGGTTSADCPCDTTGAFEPLEVLGISCNKSTGHLTGTFSLPGRDIGSPSDCSDCTAIITLG